MGGYVLVKLNLFGEKLLLLWLDRSAKGRQYPFFLQFVFISVPNPVLSGLNSFRTEWNAGFFGSSHRTYRSSQFRRRHWNWPLRLICEFLRVQEVTLESACEFFLPFKRWFRCRIKPALIIETIEYYKLLACDCSVHLFVVKLRQNWIRFVSASLSQLSPTSVHFVSIIQDFNRRKLQISVRGLFYSVLDAVRTSDFLFYFRSIYYFFDFWLWFIFLQFLGWFYLRQHKWTFIVYRDCWFVAGATRAYVKLGLSKSTAILRALYSFENFRLLHLYFLKKLGQFLVLFLTMLFESL